MIKTVSLSMVALTAFLAGVTAFDTSADARSRHHGRNLAIGLGAAAATAIILSESARASERRGYRRRGMSCGELADRCEDGSEWACDKYERRCQ